MKFLLQHFIENHINPSNHMVAIEHGERSYSYAELSELISSITLELHKVGLTKGDRLAILSPVTPQIIATMIACLKLGIIYVPLNIFAPAVWVSNVLTKCAAKALIYDAHYTGLAKQLEPAPSIQYVMQASGEILNSSGKNILLSPAEPFPYPPLLADDLAYILFTSGSTGDPKGIMISHRNAYTFVAWMTEFFALTPEDRIFSRAPLQFDLSVFDIFSTFMANATLVIVPTGFSENPEDIVKYMRDKRISVVYTVPSAYIRLLNKGNLQHGIPSLRIALYAGEPFPTPYLRNVMHALPGTVFWNIYGPTETNIITYYGIHTPPATDAPIPIGKAVFDTEIFIVDASLNRVPDGEIGEIVVRGGTIFRGYLDDAAKTNERLVYCPWYPYPETFCRTGDIGKILPDGNIQYNGRMDNMIKTRGYRVELDEVELAISTIAGVWQSAVVAVPDPHYTHTLHAFIQTDQESSTDLTPEKIQALLTEKIPAYMMPFSFTIIEEFPKTSTAKIDRVGLRKRIEDARAATA